MDRFAALEQRLKEECPGLELRRNEPMSAHTTFRVGGAAALMALPKDSVELSAALELARDMEVSPFFLGNGSNLLVSDKGYDGYIIKLSGRYNEVWEIKNGRVLAGGGLLLSRLANAALEAGLTGLEFAAGIPGTVGGAVTMNAGAYGGEMSQVLSGVGTMDTDGVGDAIPAENCDFSYRHSRFHNGECIITDAAFCLTPGDPAEIRAKMAELAAQRKAKQPLEYPSAGSTFKRPAPRPDGTPVYAAALIDGCGLKGLRVGGAQVSEKHAGFIVNTGGATCADILALMDQVRERVLRERGVELEPEVRLLGV